MTTSMIFDHETPAQRILFGAGKVVHHVSVALAGLEASRVLLIAGASAQTLADQLQAVLPVCGRIAEVVQHVPAERAEAAIALARELKADLVLSVGGGSAVGLAKMIALDSRVPIVAVPTTFSGSEATKMWGMTSNGLKQTGIDPVVLPRVVVYDAELFASLPAELIAASGMNALAHAIDGFWAPGMDPITEALAVEGARALVTGLHRLAKDPQNLAARELTLYGAYMAASSFATTGSGLHHKICHVLGGSFGMPHAQTHAVVIAYVANANIGALPELAERLRPVFGDVPLGQALWALNQAIGGPRSLNDLGLMESEIPAAAKIILPIIPMSNPGHMTETELEALLYSAWAGTEPHQNEGRK